MQRRTISLIAGLGLVMMFGPTLAMAQYQLTNLVSNQVGMAKHDDPLLVDGWGLAYAPGNPFWVSDQGSGWATLYTGTGAEKALKVEIPTASGAGVGSPTGMVFNGSQEFQVQGWPAIFLFATLDGTISGWAPQSDPNNAIIAVNNSMAGAVYTGLAITSKAAGNLLFAADNANNKVDIYDGHFNLVTSFTDPTVPAGFAPFGIQDISGLVYVAYASSSGAAGGYIDVLSETGTFVKRLTQGAPRTSPGVLPPLLIILDR